MNKYLKDLARVEKSLRDIFNQQLDARILAEVPPYLQMDKETEEGFNKSAALIFAKLYQELDEDGKKFIDKPFFWNKPE